MASQGLRAVPRRVRMWPMSCCPAANSCISHPTPLLQLQQLSSSGFCPSSGFYFLHPLLGMWWHSWRGLRLLVCQEKRPGCLHYVWQRKELGCAQVGSTPSWGRGRGRERGGRSIRCGKGKLGCLNWGVEKPGWPCYAFSGETMGGRERGCSPCGVQPLAAWKLDSSELRHTFFFLHYFLTNKSPTYSRLLFTIAYILNIELEHHTIQFTWSILFFSLLWNPRKKQQMYL